MTYRGMFISVAYLGLLAPVAACGSQPAFTSRTAEVPLASADATAGQSAAGGSAGATGTSGAAATGSGVASSTGSGSTGSGSSTGTATDTASTGGSVDSGASGSSGSGKSTASGTGTGTSVAGGSGTGTSTAGGGSGIVIPPNCDENGATQAQLLTTTLVNDSKNMVIQYKVFRTDCQGNIIPLTADEIWFDINARVPGFQPIQYTLTSGSDVQNGTMTDVVGSDLFGDTGSNYAHWEMDQPVNVSETQGNYVTLSIMLPTYEYVPLVGPSDQLPTYLKFGAAATVEKVVTLE